MTDIGYKEAVPSLRRMEDAKEAETFDFDVEWAPRGNSNIKNFEKEGWRVLAVLDGEFDISSQVEEFLASGGSPEIDFGAIKVGHKKSFTLNIKFMTQKAKAWLSSKNDPTVNLASPTNNTTVDTATDPTSETIQVAVGTGVNYTEGMSIDISTGDSTYGTYPEETFIEDVTGDIITFFPPISQLPIHGAAVRQVDSYDRDEDTSCFPDSVMLRFLMYDKNREKTLAVVIEKYKPKFGAYNAGDGKSNATAALNGTALAVHDAVNDRYVICRIREIR